MPFSTQHRAGEAADPEEFVSFTKQLQVLGLRMREVPGDGNCLFRALGDQLEGHSRNHLKHRQETADYMIRHRNDFEPFVEDDVPFGKHVDNLAQPGTFAGNDAIVAFARNNQVNVVIHQLNNPLWHIRGSDKSGARELHIAYRYGDTREEKRTGAAGTVTAWRERACADPLYVYTSPAYLSLTPPLVPEPDPPPVHTRSQMRGRDYKSQGEGQRSL